MRQVEIAKTITFDRPAGTLGRSSRPSPRTTSTSAGPDNMEIIFNRQVRCVTKGVFRTAVDRRTDDGVVINAFYRHSRIKTVPQGRPGAKGRDRH